MDSTKFTGRQEGTAVVRNQKFLDLVVKCLIKLTKVRHSSCSSVPRFSNFSAESRGRRYMMNTILTTHSGGRSLAPHCLKWILTASFKVSIGTLKSWEWQKSGKGMLSFSLPLVSLFLSFEHYCGRQVSLIFMIFAAVP